MFTCVFIQTIYFTRDFFFMLLFFIIYRQFYTVFFTSDIYYIMIQLLFHVYVSHEIHVVARVYF